MDYFLDDYVAAFHTALTGMLMRRGIQLASEAHYNTDVGNVHDLAVIAAKRIFQERMRHSTPAPAPQSVPLDQGGSVMIPASMTLTTKAVKP